MSTEIKNDEIYINPSNRTVNLISFATVDDDAAKGDTKQGCIRAYCVQHPSIINLQYRAVQSLKDGGIERNLIASAIINIEDLRRIVQFFDDRAK